VAGRAKPLKISRFDCAGYIRDVLRYLKPPENLTVSEWAERYRLLDSKTSAMPGPWRNRKTPYLVGIMDEILNYESEEVIFCKCTQVGGSEAMLNMIGYIIQQDPAPTMVVYPTDKLAESISDNRLQPMIKTSPSLSELYREFQSQKLELQFSGMYLSLVGSNSPSSLASKAIKYLMLDEVDKYPSNTKKEADPIALARERTKTFANRKIYMTSTPTLREGHIWKALENADLEKHYFVPCPHCGEMIELQFNQIKWPDKEGLTYTERADMAVYVCQECGCTIQDYQKDKMLQEGEWRIVKQNTTNKKKVAFWINTLYSPFVRFSEIALEFLNSKDDPERLQNFKNSWLAEPWEDMATHMDEDMVLERQTDTPEFVVPDWAKMLTAGVDVQKDCMYYDIRAWGDYITSQSVTHGQARDFADIDRVMNATYKNASGDPYQVMLCLVDSGYNADDTYEFCVERMDWAMPVKGSSNPMTSHYRISTVNRPGTKGDGIQLIMTDGDKYKDMIASRLHKPVGTGSWMVYQGCDREYARQLTAEHKVNVRSNGRVVQKWVPKAQHIDNHYLDCACYSLAAADIMGVRSFVTLQQENEKPEQRNEDSTPEEAWIQANEDWI
jgi:phage terminase large subunit GpA-like protein